MFVVASKTAACPTVTLLLALGGLLLSPTKKTALLGGVLADDRRAHLKVPHFAAPRDARRAARTVLRGGVLRDARRPARTDLRGCVLLVSRWGLRTAAVVGVPLVDRGDVRLAALGGALRVVRWESRLNLHRTSWALALTLLDMGTGQREQTTNRATGRYPRARLPTL